MIPRSRIVGRGDRAGLVLQESGRETGRVRTSRTNQCWVRSGYPEPGRVAETWRVSARYARALHGLIERNQGRHELLPCRNDRSRRNSGGGPALPRAPGARERRRAGTMTVPCGPVGCALYFGLARCPAFFPPTSESTLAGGFLFPSMS